MRNPKINMFYRPEMVLNDNRTNNYSRSPEKPRLLRDFLKASGLYSNFNEISDWEPFTREDFLTAHTAEYVDNFFAGIPHDCVSNGLKWSAQFADSVRYTNASLYCAVKNSLEEPRTVAFSPTSGFHHARPYCGSGFCTFSGQVIASLKLYRDRRAVGAYIDLDGHFGNSIEDAREFTCGDLDLAVGNYSGTFNYFENTGPSAVPPGVELGAGPFRLDASPNPFRGALTVSFRLPRPSPVDLALYDASGRCVGRLLQGAREAGTHFVSWSPTGAGERALPSGVYYCRLQAPGISRTIVLTHIR